MIPLSAGVITLEWHRHEYYKLQTPCCCHGSERCSRLITEYDLILYFKIGSTRDTGTALHFRAHEFTSGF
jgi:hypothetical protein